MWLFVTSTDISMPVIHVTDSDTYVYNRDGLAGKWKASQKLVPFIFD